MLHRTFSRNIELLTTSVNQQAVDYAKKNLGWRVYATNHCSNALPFDKAVLAYRHQAIAERGFSRFKNKPLSLTPTYFTREDHLIGLVRLLSIALRLLCLFEFVIRRNLSENQQTIVGLYAGNLKQSTARPTTELLLRAFRNINLSFISMPQQNLAHITQLSPLQLQVLSLLDMPPDIYQRLTISTN